VQIYVEETGQVKENILRDLNRDYWMSAAEAVDYGLCDRVVEKLGDIV
jgi:ATP-dependent Clp protease protease subunit